MIKGQQATAFCIRSSLNFCTDACSHYRAPAFYAESILVPGSFIAYQCRLEKILSSPNECTPPPVGKLQKRKGAFMGEYVDQR